MAAEAADGNRAASHQRARRHHELPHLRPRPAAACLRCEEDRRQSCRAPRASRRKPAGARRQDLRTRRDDGGDRRRQWRRIARRHHGRRTFGLRRRHDRRAHRIGAVGSAEYRANRPPARHHQRCALSFRTRCRSGLLRARRRTRHPFGARSLRRRSLRTRHRRHAARVRNHYRFSVERGQAAHRTRARRFRHGGNPRKARLCQSGAAGQRRSRLRAGAVLASRCRRQGRSRRGNSAHCRR